MRRCPTFAEGLYLLDSKPIGISVPFRTIHSNCLERMAFAPAPDHSSFCLPGYWPTMVATGDGELGFDSGEGA